MTPGGVIFPYATTGVLITYIAPASRLVIEPIGLLIVRSELEDQSIVNPYLRFPFCRKLTTDNTVLRT